MPRQRSSRPSLLRSGREAADTCAVHLQDETHQSFQLTEHLEAITRNRVNLVACTALRVPSSWPNAVCQDKEHKYEIAGVHALPSCAKSSMYVYFYVLHKDKDLCATRKRGTEPCSKRNGHSSANFDHRLRAMKNSNYAQTSQMSTQIPPTSGNS
jgi:hypothetical protein